MIDAYAYGKQGRRQYMEDRHVLRVKDERMVGAVFDGHGGDSVAAKASEKFLEFYDEAIGTYGSTGSPLDYTMKKLDETTKGMATGACAVAFELLDFGNTMRLEVQNVGDSELVYLTGGPMTLTTLHRPEDNAEEAMRVLRMGASIQLPYWYLPHGQGLMITRSLGDEAFRKWGLLSTPAVRITTFDRESAWLIVATDGLWDVVKKDDLPELLGGCDSAKTAAEWLVDEAINTRHSHDNTTVIVARIGDWEPR